MIPKQTAKNSWITSSIGSRYCQNCSIAPQRHKKVEKHLLALNTSLRGGSWSKTKLWLKADLVVYVTPNYYHTVSATLKTFIERVLPLHDRSFQQFSGRVRQPLREKLLAVVTLSVAGFPEISVFDGLGLILAIALTLNPLGGASIYTSWPRFLFWKSDPIALTRSPKQADGAQLSAKSIRRVEYLG